jgi:hypothetical protein
MLEKDIERKVCDYAKKRGCLAYKFTSPGKRSVPDRLFITPTGRVFFIEFKREGKKPTDGQWREIHRLRDAEQDVFVVDNADAGKQIVGLMVLGINVREYTNAG